MFDKSGSGVWLGGSNIGYPPEKTNTRIKQMERELVNCRDTISKKNEEIQDLNDRIKILMEANKSQNPSDAVYENSLQDQIQRLNLKLN